MLRISREYIKSITYETDPLSHKYPCITFKSEFFVSNRNEIPRPRDIIAADLDGDDKYEDQYVYACVTQVKFDPLDAEVELDAEVIEYSSLIPPLFEFDPSILKQQLIDIFKYPWS
jgi:hypothetical protein